jgi:hypothetical protein
MASQRILLGLVLALAAAGPALAQTGGTLRWRAGATPLGLQAGGAIPLPCSRYTLSCGETSTVPLYASETASRVLSMQLGPGASALGLANPSGLDVNLVGRAGLWQDLGLGVYGRVGTTLNRASPVLASPFSGETGFRYGVGLSWDFTRSASAAVGLDSFELRGVPGEGRDLRTSLGLRWRY